MRVHLVVAASLSVLGVCLFPLACTGTESNGDKREKPEDTGEVDECWEFECTLATDRDLYRLKCGDCDNAYYALSCPLRCEPCSDDLVYWVREGSPCECITDDGQKKDVPECQPDMDV